MEMVLWRWKRIGEGSGIKSKDPTKKQWQYPYFSGNRELRSAILSAEGSVSALPTSPLIHYHFQVHCSHWGSEQPATETLLAGSPQAAQVCFA